MSSFSEALSSGALGPLMLQFNLGDAVIDAANKGDIQAFAVAMQKTNEKKPEAKEDSKKPADDKKKPEDDKKKPEDDKKKPEDMEVD